MSNISMDRWVDRYTRRLRLGEFLKQAADAGAAFLFAFGAVVLSVKLLLPQFWPNVLWLGLGALPAAAVAWWLARRNPWTRQVSIARLDSALNSGGLLMTLSELPDSAWKDHLPQLEAEWRQAMPRLRPKRFASHLALPLMFAVGACFIPLRELPAETIVLNGTSQQATESLQELLNAVIEKQILDEEEKKQLETEIQKLAEEGGKIPLTHEKWETVDALREKMKFKIEAATLQSGKAQALAQRLAKAEAGELKLSAEQMEQLEKELTETLRDLKSKEGLPNGSPEMEAMLERLTKNKSGLPRSGKERQQALNDLQKMLDKDQNELKKLRKKCSSCQGGQCDKDGDGECDGEGDGNGKKPGNKSGRKPGEDGDGAPGKGGVNRGRGDAELTYGDEANDQAAKFKEVILPKGFEEQPKDDVVSVGRTAPKDEPTAPGSRSAGRDTGPATGSSTVNRVLKPRHRNVVQKYFGK